VFGLLVYFDALPVANELPLVESSSTFFYLPLFYSFAESVRGMPQNVLVNKLRVQSFLVKFRWPYKEPT